MLNCHKDLYILYIGEEMIIHSIILFKYYYLVPNDTAVLQQKKEHLYVIL